MDSILLSPLHRAIRQITLSLGAAVEPLGVRAEEGHLLTYLRKFEPTPVGEVARVFGMSGSTLTGVLDRLAAAGLFVREPNPADRRSFHLRLTPTGRKVAERVQTLADAFERRVRTRVDARDLAGMQAVLQAIAEVTRVEVRPPNLSSQKEPNR
jgi:DNA-binding MarR family transcriptional regulator